MAGTHTHSAGSRHGEGHQGDERNCGKNVLHVFRAFLRGIGNEHTVTVTFQMVKKFS